MKFVDLFAGIGGFHQALASLGHECVFASELDPELRDLYEQNFAGSGRRLHGDIRKSKSEVPAHDILCAGFPCQPFSKSGTQHGVRDKTRGTLFHEIIEILRARLPQFVILENVGNFERHNAGKTWEVVRSSLAELGYNVRGTTHKASKGHGLISPHHLGFPHTRERFFIVASLSPLPEEPFPARKKDHILSLRDILQSRAELTGLDRIETAVGTHYLQCIDHWNELIQRIPISTPLPSFPIWGDEISATYPFVGRPPAALTGKALRRFLPTNATTRRLPKRHLLAMLPSYARNEPRAFPAWKAGFIRQNREWFGRLNGHVTSSWVETLQGFPPSLRKLEWNCQGETRDLWECVLQFRPSGLRAKRFTSCPALVAMTETQIPILGPKRRYISRIEGLRLQAFPDTHRLPLRRDRAFAALGNAVHVGVVREIAARLLGPKA